MINFLPIGHFTATIAPYDVLAIGFSTGIALAYVKSGKLQLIALNQIINYCEFSCLPMFINCDEFSIEISHIQTINLHLVFILVFEEVYKL